MQKGHLLEFECQACQTPIQFSVFALESKTCEVTCESCRQRYLLDDEVLKRQIKKFAALCRQLIDSEEILSKTHVGIHVGDKEVKVPYRLLLTRFSSSLDLMMGEKPVSIYFRFEPLQDTIKAESRSYNE